MKRFVLCFLLCVFSAGLLTAQFSRIPAGTRLMQIKNDTVRVIFPAGYEKEASRIAATVSAIRQTRIRSLREGPLGPIDILLQTQTTIPNAFVGLAPLRSEFFLTPMQDNLILGPGNWSDILSIHEYRHVQQFYNAKVGLTKVFSVLSGEYGWAVTSFLAVPDWFWEGDAVVYETALTTGGRGRYPSFLKEYRAFAKEGISISYDQARLGSYVNYSPGHYPLGYMMTVYGRNKYRQDLWNDVFRDAASWRVPFLGVSRSLKKRTGENASAMFRNSQSYFANYWQNVAFPVEEGRVTMLSVPVPRTQVITEYRFPHPQSDGSLLALKESFDQTEAIVQIKDGKETVLSRPGFSYNVWFSSNADWLVWSEVRNDPKWETRDFSVIVAKNRKTGEQAILGENGRYFSPSVHPEKTDALVAISYEPGRSPEVTFFSLANGDKRRSVSLTELDFASHSRFDGDGVLFIGKSGQENAVFRLGPDDKLENLTGWVNHPLATPFGTDSLILFTSTFEGTDAVYAVTRGGRRFFRLTNPDVGAYDPQMDASGNLFWSDFTSRGHRLRTLPAALIQKEPVKILPLDRLPNPINAVAEYEGGAITGTIPERTFSATPYPANRELLNIHSWTLSGAQPEYTAWLFSNNITATLLGTGSLTYNTNSKSTDTRAEFYYSGMYPVIRGSVRYTHWADDVNFQSNTEIGAGVLFPFRRIHGNFLGLHSLQADVFVRDATPTSTSNFSDNPIFSPNTYLRLAAFSTHYRRKARRNPYTALGYEFSGAYRKSITSGVDLNRFQSEARVYLPGIMVNQNVVLSSGYWRDADVSTSIIDNTFRFPRGYKAVASTQFVRLSANYTGTLSYFHRRLGALIYANRLRGNVFFDYGTFQNRNSVQGSKWELMSSYGAEAILDTYWFRLLPIEFIIRYVELAQNRDPNVPSASIQFGLGVIF